MPETLLAQKLKAGLRNSAQGAQIMTDLATLITAGATAALTTAFAALPSTDPAEAGALWNDHGVLKISAGA